MQEEQWREILDCTDSTWKMFRQWQDFLCAEVEFGNLNSTVHTKAHAVRVLLFALTIAQRQKLSLADCEALAVAAAFHDSRRQDDGLDTGHGARAARYYQKYCRQGQLTYDEGIVQIIFWHDLDDEAAISYWDKRFSRQADRERVRSLYRIFKDADALDRFRIASDALDVRYLRTPESKEMVLQAKRIVVDALGMASTDPQENM